MVFGIFHSSSNRICFRTIKKKKKKKKEKKEKKRRKDIVIYITFLSALSLYHASIASM